MNTDPVSLLPQQLYDSLVPTFLHMAWTILWSPAGAMLLGVVALRVLLAGALYVKRQIDHATRM